MLLQVSELTYERRERLSFLDAGAQRVERGNSSQPTMRGTVWPKNVWNEMKKI
jgi:hypothetical protein